MLYLIDRNFCHPLPDNVVFDPMWIKYNIVRKMVTQISIGSNTTLSDRWLYTFHWITYNIVRQRLTQISLDQIQHYPKDGGTNLICVTLVVVVVAVVAAAAAVVVDKKCQARRIIGATVCR